MLARRMLEVYEPSRARRNALYREKVPGIMARLQAAELIARRIGLINRDVFSFSSGIFIREYRRNLAIMKLISHALYELEMGEWIKVSPDKIYYLDRKAVQTTSYTQKNIIFDVIAETVKEIATTFDEAKFSRKSAQEIETACRDIFQRTSDLGRAAKHEGKRMRTFRERHDFSPITKRAAMDIAASGFFYVENKKVFERSAVQHMIISGDRAVDEARRIEAMEFDQYLNNEVAASKEFSGAELRGEFTLGPADRAPLFPREVDEETMNETREVFRALECAKEPERPYDLTFIISDLHLQDYVHRDLYELLRLIHVVVSTGGTLIINGDFLDTWRANSLPLIIKNNKILFDALRKVKRVVLIKGNHDGWLELFNGQKVLGENVSVVDRLWMKDLHIEHGNDFDRFNSEISWLGRLATQAVNVVERNEFVGPQALTWIEYVGKRFTPDGRWAAQKVDRVFRGIKEVYKRRDPKGDIYTAESPLNIVFGHYHFPGLYNAYEKINKMIESDQELKGRVRFFLTDSWYNSEGYAGQVTVFAKKKERQTGQLLTSTFIWDYIDAKKILTLYGAWKF